MMNELPLGRQVEQPRAYAPELLVAIPRTLGRQAAGIDPDIFVGLDRWRAWEFSWQTRQGQRQVGILDIGVPADSPCMVESKSLKLFLNSCFYQSFADETAVCDEISTRLSALLGAGIEVTYRGLQQHDGFLLPVELPGICLDDLPSSVAFDGQVRALDRRSDAVSLCHSHLFRSLCPVTGQPDWASVLVEMRGVEPDPGTLLSYLLSYAEHQAFHESCVERIFQDLWQQCGPAGLAVTARFTRRGGIDINPFRASSADMAEQNLRTLRQ